MKISGLERYETDLNRWMPRLIAVWRRRQGSRGPADRLTSPELRQVGAAVRTLSIGLTRSRELVGTRYMDDPRLLGAYLLFFWPVSYAQGRQVLGEIALRPRTALDLGSGPAPLAFAALDAGAMEVLAADRSQAALNLARELAVVSGESLRTRLWDLSTLKRGSEGVERYDVITIGHVLNELFTGGSDATARRAAMVEHALSQLKPLGSLVLIEPALRETSRSLLRVRDVLVERGYAVRAPCFFRGNCPALVRESDWCHADRGWQMPRTVEEIARAAGIRKDSVKMSYLVLAPKEEPWKEPPPGRVFRIISEPLKGKGRRRYVGCGPEGRFGLALQEKHRTAANARFFDLERGDVVAITEPEPRGDGLALTERSAVQQIARAGELVNAQGAPIEPFQGRPSS
ncbi:MAG TPA: small ribosomal subunit Rsm22 family protein [Myxococcales bacterium]